MRKLCQHCYLAEIMPICSNCCKNYASIIYKCLISSTKAQQLCCLLHTDWKYCLASSNQVVQQLVVRRHFSKYVPKSCFIKYPTPSLFSNFFNRSFFLFFTKSFPSGYNSIIVNEIQNKNIEPKYRINSWNQLQESILGIKCCN